MFSSKCSKLLAFLAFIGTTAAETCAITGTYGNPVEAATLINASEYCLNSPTGTCTSDMATSIQGAYNTLVGYDLAGPFSTALVSCMCDADVAAAGNLLSNGGYQVSTSSAATVAMCANSGCKDDVFNSAVGGHGGAAAVACATATDAAGCTAAAANISAAMTECVCDANTAGFFYYVGRPVSTDGSGMTYCGIPACSALAQMLSGFGVVGASACPNMGAIIGGAVGGAVFLIIVIAIFLKQRSSNTASSSSSAGKA